MSETITAYSTPTCVQCTAIYRALDDKRIRYAIVDLTEDVTAIEHVEALGYVQVPVVITPSDS